MHAPGADPVAEAPEAAEAIVAILAANGVTDLFVMPGDAFALLEAVEVMGGDGRPVPRVVVCLHEVVALAAAHGHFMVSGRPQACLFHVDVGVQMAGGMLHNAQRGRAGVVILSGRTPMSLDGKMRGGRVIDMHWMQDRVDQASVTRGYVKWHADLHRTEPIPQVLQRAFQVAASEPCGPVSVTLLREMLMEPAVLEPLPVARHAAVRPPVPALEDLRDVAALIAAAERPLAIAGYVGRSAAGFHALQAFAEDTAVPVVSRGARANLSTDSPMHAGTDPGELLATADLVLLLDVDVPYIPAFGPPPADARVVQIDIDALKIDIPVWGFPVDIALQGNTAAALPVLASLVQEVRTPAQTAAAEVRAKELASDHDEAVRGREEAARTKAQETPIALEYVSRCVAELVDEQTIVVDDCTTAMTVTAAYVPTRVPGGYFQPMGSSMGWGMGAALGAKLASPHSTVINLNAEGNVFSGVPEASLWAAAQHDAPFMTVVLNNAQYAAIKLGLGFEYPGARTLRPGGPLDLPSAPDLVAIARGCGAHAEHVDDPVELPNALQRGLEAVRGGRCAVLDVVVAGPVAP